MFTSCESGGERPRAGHVAEKASLSEDIKSVYSEAEHLGLDKKALRAVILLRRKDKAERDSL
jgi:uncharacterized protein (UPF0335 family)